jgi:hypothetical protein
MKTSMPLRLCIAMLAPMAALPALARQDPAAAGSTPASAGAASPRARDWPGCIRDTGTHVPAKDRHCLAVPGRSYDSDDIRRTGATTVGDALDKLDPSISVRRH